MIIKFFDFHNEFDPFLFHDVCDMSSRIWVVVVAIPNNLFRSRTDGLFSQSRYNDMPLDYFYGVMHKCTNTTLSFQKAENLICITEDKLERNLIEGFAQNIKQLECSFQTIMRKRKREDDDDFDYLYGIVTTARDWYFLLGKFHKAVNYHLASNFPKMP